MTKSSVDRSTRYGEYVTLRFHKPYKLYDLTWNNESPYLIARFAETDGEYAIKLWETLERLCFENNELKNESVVKNHQIDYWKNQCKKLEDNIECMIEDKKMLESEFIQPMKEEIKDLKKDIDILYRFRLMYNALLFNEWYKHGDVEVYKSKRHSDGTIPFEYDSEDWFIVVAILHGKQISNHYCMDYWDYFKIPAYDKVKDEFDEHTSDDVLDRLMELLI